MHAGEPIRVRMTVTRAGQLMTGGEVSAGFWAPGRDPEADPGTRADPDHQVPCAYDERSRRWTARVVTDGWTPGIWTVGGRIEDPGGGVRWVWQLMPLAA